MVGGNECRVLLDQASRRKERHFQTKRRLVPQAELEQLCQQKAFLESDHSQLFEQKRELEEAHQRVAEQKRQLEEDHRRAEERRQELERAHSQMAAQKREVGWITMALLSHITTIRVLGQWLCAMAIHGRSS